MDVQTLVDKAGGPAEFAEVAGVARTTVYDWIKAGFVPGNRVAEISAALRLPITEVLKLVQPPRGRKQRTFYPPSKPRRGSVGAKQCEASAQPDGAST